MFDERLTVTGDRPDIEELYDLLHAAPAWHADASCKEAPATADFFPAPRSKALQAKAICERCLVRDACRSWALDQGSDLCGVWGGTTEADRARLRREKRAKRAA